MKTNRPNQPEPRPENRHTPGPWHLDNPSLRGFHLDIVGTDGRFTIGIATVHRSLGHGEDDANARLIAAAPAMADFIASFRAAMDDCDPESDAERADVAVMYAEEAARILKAAGVL